MVCMKPGLAHEEFKKEVHTFAAAYKAQEIRRILKYSDSIIFNSFYQLQKYGEIARKSGVEIGLRVNPGHAEVATEMYNPCAPCSRLGIIHDVFKKEFPKHKNIVDGLHFHAMCEQNSDVLERILNAFEKLYGPYIRGLKWVNFGGGHHITRDDYDLERLIKLINTFKKRYGVQVYLEPGEASVYQCGSFDLVCSGYCEKPGGDRDTGCICRNAYAGCTAYALQAAHNEVSPAE